MGEGWAERLVDGTRGEQYRSMDHLAARRVSRHRARSSVVLKSDVNMHQAGVFGNDRPDHRGERIRCYIVPSEASCLPYVTRRTEWTHSRPTQWILVPQQLQLEHACRHNLD